MVYEYRYDEALERCVMLSSYEGRESADGSGETKYLQIKNTEQDRPLILVYIAAAARLLQERMSRMITSAEYNETGFVWTVRTEETRWNVNTKLDKNIQESLVSYAMMNWLAERKPDRVDMYRQLWQDMTQMCVANLFRKSVPTKMSKKERESMLKDIDEVEVSISD